MGNRKMRKGGMKAKKGCRDCERTTEVAHNAAEWYSKEVVPQVGANFSVLTTYDVEPRLLTNGMYVNALTHFQCILTPPLDLHSSFHQKMLDLYTELREVNAGASNYNPVVLGVYMHNVVTLRALMAYIRRGLAAVRFGNALFRESPNVFMAAAGYYSYDVEAAAYAQNFNDFALLCKDVEELPIPGVSILDRYEFLFDKVFADSQTTRPAIMSFVPREYFVASENSGAYVFTSRTVAQPTTASSTIANMIAAARTLYGTIIGVPNNAIIRGDMIKAYGVNAMRRNLVSQISNHFSIGYSEDVASQLENTAIMSLNAGCTIAMSTAGGAATCTAARAYAETGYILDEARRVINFHGEVAPRDEALMAITRLAVTGVNGSSIVINSSSGVVVMGSQFMNINAGVTTRIGDVGTWIHDTHSSIQSTVEAAYGNLATFLTLVDHYPMVLHHPSNPNGAIIDMDNAAYIAADTLMDMTELANRSLYSCRIPRKADGHFMR